MRSGWSMGTLKGDGTEVEVSGTERGLNLGVGRGLEEVG